MVKKVIKGFNLKKYKRYQQSRLNLNKDKSLGWKLKKEKWLFLRFDNNFKFFPKIKTTKLKFFFNNILNVRRVLSSQNCCINSTTLKKIYFKANKGHPKYLNFLNLLESRLDVCLYRTGFFKTPSQLRQYIRHNNIYLNGCLVTKPGIFLQKNDLIQISFVGKSFWKPIKNLQTFSHLELSVSTFSFVYLGFFTEKQVPYLDKNYLSFLNYTFKR